MAEKDYIAMWFNVRKPYGISDTVYWGWYDPATKDIDWKTWQHADADGMIGFTNILRPMGYPCYPLPVCNETSVPSWREIRKAQKEFGQPPAANQVKWKQTYPCVYSPNDTFMPEVRSFSEEDTQKLKAWCKENKVSFGNLVYATMSKVVSARMIEGDEPFSWFFPVNVRGATGIKTESFNQASGIYIEVNKNSELQDWQAQMRLRLKSKEQWKNWKLANIGKYVGERGVALIYKLTSGKQFYAGNCSNLGEWPLPGQDNPPRPDQRVLAAVAPGTANYPISGTTLEWYGQLTLTFKMHPYVCDSQELIAELADAWYEALMGYIR